MAADGHDLDGEARSSTRWPRARRAYSTRAADRAGWRRLAALGHHVVGVDVDADLIAAADREHPGPTWITADLAELDLSSVGISDGFDVIVSAGNVMPFLDPATRSEVVKRLAAHLSPDGRLAVGFGAGRGYDFDDFFADVAKAGLRDELRLSTWDLRPFSASSDFLVAVLAH